MILHPKSEWTIDGNARNCLHTSPLKWDGNPVTRSSVTVTRLSGLTSTCLMNILRIPKRHRNLWPVLVDWLVRIHIQICLQHWSGMMLHLGTPTPFVLAQLMTVLLLIIMLSSLLLRCAFPWWTSKYLIYLSMPSYFQRSLYVFVSIHYRFLHFVTFEGKLKET